VTASARASGAGPVVLDDGFVEVEVTGQPEEAGAIAATVSELLGRLGLHVHTRSSGATADRIDAAPAANGERARVRIDGRAPESIAVEVYAFRSGARGPVLKRTVMRGGSREITADAVGHIVEATVESALVASADPAPEAVRSDDPLTEPSASLPAPPDSPPPTPGSGPRARAAATDAARAPRDPAARPVDRPSFGLDAAAFVDGAELGPRSGVALGGGGALTLSWNVQWRPALSLAAAFHAPFDVSGPDATLETSVAFFYVVPSVQIADAGVVQVRAGAGGGADAFHATPRDSHGPFPHAPRAETHVSGVATGWILGHLRIGSAAGVVAGVALDWNLDRHRYAVLDGSGHTSVAFQPSAVRPVFLLGLCIPLAGASTCGGP
jgi:hypothetical protein